MHPRKGERTDEKAKHTGDENGRFGKFTGDAARRDVLKTLGVGASALLGTSVLSGSADAAPPNESNWSLKFEDTFSSGSLDTSSWEVGFGWGMDTTASAERITSDHVNFRNDKLVIDAAYNGGDVTAGCINSKDLVTVSPGDYMEARLKAPKREGFLPAFWGKPNSEAWPPEIDVFELFQNGDGWQDYSTANYNVHYSTSTEPGDGSTHTSDPTHHSTGVDLTESFHVYGCKWLTDRVEWYFDGQKVGESTNATAMEALRKGAPFYMMLNIHIDKIGTTDKSESWNEELVVDWVRVWEQGDGSSSGSGGSDDGSDTTATEHYFWARSADGNPIDFEFTADPGNITQDFTSSAADYSISDDGTTASGTTSSTGTSLPGFWFDGEITDLQYDGNMELYIDDQAVDPDQYVSDDQATEHYLWVRSGDGNSISFEFDADPGDVSQDFTSSVADYYVSDDGTTAGGTTSSTGSSLPGFRFRGDVTRFSYEGDLELFIDDQPADPDSFPSGDSGETTEPLPRTLTVDGSGTSKTSTYSVSVSNDLQATDTTDSGDDVSGTTASGTVAGGVDEYTFDGAVTSISMDGNADVYVDGTKVKTLTVESAPGDSNVIYLIETSGRVLPAAETLESSDESNGSKAFGRADSGGDQYWVVDGDVTDVSTYRGSVDVTVDGSPV